jgi:hypothetical protein
VKENKEEEPMTNRDAQLKAWREYQEALREVGKKNPRSTWYEAPADDESKNAQLSYDPSNDSLTFFLNGDNFKIPGKYFKALKVALDSLLEEKRS